jgi:hypothetical protein
MAVFHIEISKADRASLVLAYRQAVQQGYSVKDYADYYEYHNEMDAIPFINEGARLNATEFNGVSDYDLREMARAPITGSNNNIGEIKIV